MPVMTVQHITATLALAALLCSCSDNGNTDSSTLFTRRTYPYAIAHGNGYYYTMQDTTNACIRLWHATDLHDLAADTGKVIWQPSDTSGMRNIWSPEIHRINGKWYVYYEADDGNTDNHHINVLENASADPMQGHFTHKGVVTTNREWNWSIHPSTFTVKGHQYLIWSGWPKRRAEEETQCIYIAAMKNPWTIGSERVMISRPDYEWERQWINPDGSRSAYPIYVNENPEPVMSRDGRHIIICYAASANWTVYNVTGMIYADVDSDLLNPASWHKRATPVFMSKAGSGFFGACNISVVGSADGKTTWLLYETKQHESSEYVKSIRLKRMQWDADGFPVFGTPGVR